MLRRLFVMLLLLAPIAAFAGKATEPSDADNAVAAEIKKSFWGNSYLQGSEIDTRVVEGVAYLTGTVWKPIERDLAGEIAKGTKGVRKVKNEIVVKPPQEAVAQPSPDSKQAAGQQRNKFARWADDASTTAAVKTRLLANSSTKGLKINVDTADDVVTLRGEVGSAEERDLAEMIAKNTTDVARVDNQLEIKAAETPATETAGATDDKAKSSR